MSRVLAVLFLVASQLLAHGGQFRPPGGQPGVPTPPGLPAQPTAPSQTGKINHSWTVWWGYSQFQYLDYRRLQRERRGPVSGTDSKKDADSWRDELRTRLIPVLREAIKDKDKEVRTAAAVALGKLEAKDAIDDLLKMLKKDKLQEAREAALTGLMYMREPQLRETFVKIVTRKSERIRVRGFALFGIGRLGDKESVAYLQAFFDRKDKRAKAIMPSSTGERRQFQVACLAALLMGESTGLDDFFVQVAQDKRLDEHVRAYAVTALGKLKARGKLPELVAFLRDPRQHEQIRRSAAVALGVTARPADVNAFEALKHASVGERDYPIKHFSLVSMGRIGGNAAVKQLLKHVERAKNEDREFTLIALGLTKDPRAAPVLVKALRSERNAKRKAAAAIAIGLHGDRALAGDLHQEYDRAKDWLLLQSCSLSIGMLGYKPAAKRLEEVLTTKKQPALRMAAALAYALLRQHAAVPLFVDMLRSTDSIVTLTALVRVMSYLTSPNAAKPLENLYADTKVQRQIRAYALVSLGQLADRADFPMLMTMGFDINYFIRCPPLDEAITIL
ncbi:MAG: HEAT repeat domain-containing protein [Planctomycetota bacterium]|jgi:HEAT repeat protein